MDQNVSIAQRKWDPNALLSTAMVGSVPAGIYAKEAIVHFGLWDELQNQIVQTDNVRSALRLVELGEVDFGLVYYSDAVTSKAVQIVERLPSESHSSIEYHVALVESDITDDVQKLYDLISSEIFADILQSHGFVVPN
jgi:molybdate transport system substrate-binding protein